MSGGGGSNYSVGVTIHMVDRFSAGMSAFGRSLLAQQRHVNNFHTKMKQLHQTMATIHMAEKLGHGMMNFGASGLQAVVEPAKEYVHQLNLMNMAGLKQTEIQKNIAAAWDASSKMQFTNPTDNIKALMDLKNFFADSKLNMDEARHLLPSFLKSQAILTASAHDTGFDAHGETYAMAKSMEMIGAVNDPKRFEHEMDMMNRVAVATGGRVLPSHYQNVFKYARQGKLLMNEDFKYKILPELIMEMQSGNGGAGGGGGPGAMIAAAMRLGVQGIMSKATAMNLGKLGLLGGKIIETTSGHTQVEGNGGLIHSKEFASNPQKWVEDYMVPALIRKHPELKGDSVGLLMAVATTLKGNQNAVALLQELIQKGPQFKRFGNALDAVPSGEQLYKSALKDPGIAWDSFNASMETFKISIGQNVIPIVVPALNAFSGSLNAIGKYFNENKWAGNLVVASLAAMTFVGALLSVGAAIAGPVMIASIFGVSAALGPLAAWIAGITVGVTAITWAILDWKTANDLFNKGVRIAKGIFLQVIDSIPLLGAELGLLNNALKFITGMDFGEMALSMKSFFASLWDNVQKFAGIGAKIFGDGFNNALAEIKKLSNDKSIDARFDQTMKATSQNGKAPVLNQTNNIQLPHIKNTAEAHGVVNMLGEQIAKRTRQAVRATTSAGGSHTSTGHTGAHS